MIPTCGKTTKALYQAKQERGKETNSKTSYSLPSFLVSFLPPSSLSAWDMISTTPDPHAFTNFMLGLEVRTTIPCLKCLTSIKYVKQQSCGKREESSGRLGGQQAEGGEVVQSHRVSD